MSTAAEAGFFCRYLTGREPSDYVVRYYQKAVAAEAQASERLPPVDRASLALAGWGWLGARIADGYGRIFRPNGALRRRLILMLAILEHTPATTDSLTSAREGPAAVMLASAGLTLLAGAACLLAGMVLLGPLHLLDWLGGGPTPR